MLIASKEITANFTNEERIFELFESLAIELCGYLRQVEGLKVIAVDNLERPLVRKKFSTLPLDVQKMKVANFIRYYDHCVHLIDQGISLRDKRESLKAFSFIHGLQLPSPDEIYSALSDTTYVEIYDRRFLQSYRSPDWLETTSHSLLRIETHDWRDLFFRSEKIAHAQMDLVYALFSGGINQPVYRPLSIHTVKEITAKNPFCAEIESLIYSPVYDTQMNFAGGLHIMKLHDLRRISMQICSHAFIEDLSH